VTIKRYLYIEIGDIDMYIEFEMLKVKVSIKFLGTMGFSLRREGCYRIEGNNYINEFPVQHEALPLYLPYRAMYEIPNSTA
jgi:hypothetical protein